MDSLNLVAKAKIEIDASVEIVWDALVNPETIRKYMFGTTVVTDWKSGSRIIWKGEGQGKHYEGKGRILQVKPEHLLQYTHLSAATGQADLPENYQTVTIELTDTGDKTFLSLKQDRSGSEIEQKDSEKSWRMMLTKLKDLLEGKS